MDAESTPSKRAPAAAGTLLPALVLPLAPSAPTADLGADSSAVGLDTLLTDLASVRQLALRLTAHADDAIRAGHLHAFGLVHDHQRQLLEVIAGPDRAGLERALTWLVDHHGARRVRAMLDAFRVGYLRAGTDVAAAPEAPPGTDHEARAEVETRGVDAGAPGGSAAGKDDAATLGQLVLLWLANENPAAAPFRPLFDDRPVQATSGYRSMIASLGDYFATPEADAEMATSGLFAALTAPVQAAPSSPAEQLRAVLAARRPHAERVEGGARHAAASATADATRDPARHQPGYASDTRRHAQLLRGLDVLREEEKPGFLPGPPPPPPVPDFAALAGGAARYSAEAGWMRELVLVAKNVLVWLDQLSGQTGRDIDQLDQIPDAELARLRRWGITGLWLIGIWQRSPASARIKQLCGNPEAAASAYAVDDYVIEPALGGDAALDVLARRAARHGIRLACDMVPNHMGLDSRWVLDHPERFLQVDAPPFPGYQFEGGPDLSPRPDVGLHLEEGYFDRRDAAVVFRRVARGAADEPGEAPATAFLYHGNDGTSLPWNDTAQLDFMRLETRQAVLETILDVAKRFPIIRFDAAMTLARQHVQRLWHPLPGKGGDVPSRAEHAVSQDTFDAHMPDEFWREVVDRASIEAPDTLLLAEAFWLMETYFVRSLGMHRVYNSAFMHMIRDEDNARFHRFVAEALAFDPALVARFVSFATTPDEPPAAEQLGTGDKYFAVATLLSAMPGTPLLGHGQIEGLREKYGMEYRRAYRNETPNESAVARHEAELVPLLARRATFAAADAFELYTFEKESGHGAADDVIAISNRLGASRALVIVHNRSGHIRGRLRRTVPRPRGDEEASSVSIARALGADAGAAVGTVLRGRDLLTDETVWIDGSQLERDGLRVTLGPYARIVWADLVIHDPEADSGNPTEIPAANVESASERALRALLAPALVRRLLDLRPVDGDEEGAVDDTARAEAHRRWAAVSIERTGDDSHRTMVAALDAWIALRDQTRHADDLRTVPRETDAQPTPRGRPANPSARWPALLAWVFVHSLGHPLPAEDDLGSPVSGVDPRRVLFDLLAALGCATHTIVRHVAAASRFSRHPGNGPPITAPADLVAWLEDDADAAALLGKHEHDGVTWIEQEGVRMLCWWLTMTARLTVAIPSENTDPGVDGNATSPLHRALALVRAVAVAERTSGYRWLAFRRALRGYDPSSASPIEHEDEPAPVGGTEDAET